MCTCSTLMKIYLVGSSTIHERVLRQIKEVCYSSFYYAEVKFWFWYTCNVMLRLILNLTKQVPDNQYTQLEKCKVLIGLHFAAEGFVEENAKKFVIFHIRGVFFPTLYMYFSSERDPVVVRIVSHILKSLFYQHLAKPKFR